MRNLPVWLSGADAEVLARFPGDRARYTTLGSMLLVTGAMATVSMWFALHSALGVSALAAIPFALAWGLGIITIDRMLVVSMQRSGSSMVPMANLAPPNSPAQPNNPAQAGNTAQPTSTTQQNKPARAEKRKRRTGNLLWMALPRVALALLLGVVISTPIVLRIFQSEIKTQISIIKDNNEVNFLNSQQHSAIQARINTWQPIVTNLQGVITSNGAKPLNPDSDPVVQGLTIQLTNEQSVAATDYEAWQCQLYGGCGAPKGSGPLAAASEKRYDADETQIASLTTQIQEREQALQAASATSQAARLGQAKSALPNAQAQLKAAQTEEDALLSNFQSANGATNGLLIRLQALD